ncbi:MAG: hypothetical protein KJ964_00155 [Verrucomicrobia bacterium]|nr:hypothetical protein [Verrucomicrobiota bacterium]MBU1736208.1 hypothetical protein [Verrucomicrobiota bacterium]MBU1856565.1 hypothetical protein [Verrucomicrobiota bacterium]
MQNIFPPVADKIVAAIADRGSGESGVIDPGHRKKSPLQIYNQGERNTTADSCIGNPWLMDNGRWLMNKIYTEHFAKWS